MFNNFLEKDSVKVKLDLGNNLRPQVGFKNLLVAYSKFRLFKSIFVSENHMCFKMSNKKFKFNLVTRKASDVRIRFVRESGRLSKPIHNFKRDINSPVFKDGKHYVGLVVYNSRYGSHYYYVKFDKKINASSLIKNIEDNEDIYIDDILESQVYWDN